MPRICCKRIRSLTHKEGETMEENGKQDSAANMMNVNENCMDIEVIRKQEEMVSDRLSYANEELITPYLDTEMIDQRFLIHTVHDVDFFLYHPQQLSEMHHPSLAMEWYFMSPACKKYSEGGRCNSSNNYGYWEPCGTDSLIHKDGKLIGYRKTLNYIEGKHEKDRKQTEWLVHEYRLDGRRDVRTGTTSDDIQWVFCKLFKSGDQLLEAEDKVATKFAGPNAGVASTDHTIQGPEKANALTDDPGLNNCHSCDLHPLPETDQGITAPSSSSKLLDQASKISGFDKPVAYFLPQHEQAIVPTPKPQHVQRTIVTPSPPASDQRFMMPHLPNEKSQPMHDQGTVVSPPLSQNDQITMPSTSTGPHKANYGVVTDKGPSNYLNRDLHPLATLIQGLLISRCSKKYRGGPTGICIFDETIATPWHERSTMLPPRPQHGPQKVPHELRYDQQTMVPPLSGILNVNNDKTCVKPPMLNHRHDALNLPSSDQVPKLPSVDGSTHGSHANEAVVAPRYHGWPFNTAKRLPPLDGPFESLTEQELAAFDKPGPEYSWAYENKRKRPRND